MQSCCVHSIHYNVKPMHSAVNRLWMTHLWWCDNNTFSCRSFLKAVKQLGVTHVNSFDSL